MKKSLIGVLIAAFLVLSMPALSQAITGWPSWDVSMNFSAKVQVKYVNGEGKTVSLNRTLTDDGTGFFTINGPDNLGNELVLLRLIDASGNTVRCSPVGTVVTKVNKGQFTGSWDSGAENTWPTYLTLDGGNYYMNPGDVNASYAEAKTTINSRTNLMNITMKATIVGLFHTPDGDFPARVTIKTGTKDMNNFPSAIANFERPIVYP